MGTLQNGLKQEWLRLTAENAQLQATATEIESRARRLEDVSCRQQNEIERLRVGLDAAIRAANLALFVIRKQGVMPNSSWEGGFNSDLEVATIARGTLGETET